MQGAGELAQEIHVRIDAGDAIGEHRLVVYFRVGRMVPAGHRFGDHHRKIWNTGDGRGVHVVEDETEFLLELFGCELFVRMGEIQFHLVVHVAAVFRMLVRVVLVPAGLDVRQQSAGLFVVSLHPGGAQLVFGEFEFEVDLAELAGLDFLGFRVVTQQLGCYGGPAQVPALQIVISVEVGGDARGGAVEIHSYEGDAFPFFVHHPAADLGGLGRRTDAEHQRYQGEGVFFQLSHVFRPIADISSLQIYTNLKIIAQVPSHRASRPFTAALRVADLPQKTIGLERTWQADFERG